MTQLLLGPQQNVNSACQITKSVRVGAPEEKSLKTLAAAGEP